MKIYDGSQDQRYHRSYLHKTKTRVANGRDHENKIKRRKKESQN